MAPRRILEFDPTKFAKSVARLRRARKLTREQVSEQTGLSADTIKRVERHKLRSLRTCAVLSVWADLDIKDFVHINLKEPQP